MEHHPGPAVAALMKLSFDEEHRHAICCLGWYSNFFPSCTWYYMTVSHHAFDITYNLIMNLVLHVSPSCTWYVWKASITLEIVNQDKCPKYNGSTILLCTTSNSFNYWVKQNTLSTLVQLSLVGCGHIMLLSV